jgi:hypothetical protein
MRAMKPIAWWGAVFAGVAFLVLGAMLTMLNQAGCAPVAPPHGQSAAQLAQFFGLDMMFVVAYVAAFVAAAQTFMRRRMPALLLAFAACATGALDLGENLSALAALHDVSGPACAILTAFPGLTAAKWAAAALIGVALIFVAPVRGYLSGFYVWGFGILFTLAAIAAALAPFVAAPGLAGRMMQGLAPLLLLPGMFGLCLLLWSDARRGR